MTTTASKPTLKDLRAEAHRLGITAESAGCSIDELLRMARENDDPLGFLAIYAPDGDIDDNTSVETAAAEKTPAEEVEQDAEEPIGDVPTPLPEPPSPEPPSVVSVSAPLSNADLNGCYISTHADVHMSHEQGRTLRRLHLALDAEGARLASGRRIITSADAVRWLLEQINQRS
jgi:hypothetical protein